MSAEETHVVIRDAAGVSTAFRLAEGALIRQDPFTGQTQVVTAGDGSRRQDTRTPQGVWSDQSGGAGEWAYDEVQELTSFTDSQCDTRYGMVTLPPSRFRENGNLPYNVVAWAAIYAGEASATVIAAPLNGSSGTTLAVFDPTAGGGLGAWVTKQVAAANIYGVLQFCRYRGKYHATATTQGVVSSTDGAAWTAKASGGPTTPRGCCVHDNKFWVFDAFNNRLYWTTDPTSGTWSSQSASLYLDPGDLVWQLAEWRDPRGKPVVFILTKNHLYWYDEDEDAYKEFDDYSDLNLGVPQLLPWRRDLNLYALVPNSQTAPDRVVWYSGTSNLTSPSLRGGLPAASRALLRTVAAGRNWLYFAGSGYNGLNTGRVYAVDDAQAWHFLFQADAADDVAGVVVGPGYLYVFTNDGDFYRLPEQDDTANPLTASGRTYNGNSTVHWHEFAWFDGGTENMPLTALWATIQARDMTNSGAAGTPAASRIYLEYKLQGDAGWTNMVGGVGYLTSTDAFPAVVRFAPGGVYGVKFRQIKLRVGLWSSSSASSPCVTSVALAYLRDEKPRYAYTMELDFSDMDHPLYRGKDRAQLADILEGYAQPGELVDFYFARGDETPAPPTGKVVANCRAEYSAIYHPTLGIMAARVLLKDFAPPASGV